MLPPGVASLFLCKSTDSTAVELKTAKEAVSNQYNKVYNRVVAKRGEE